MILYLFPWRRFGSSKVCIRWCVIFFKLVYQSFEGTVVTEGGALINWFDSKKHWRLGLGVCCIVSLSLCKHSFKLFSKNILNSISLNWGETYRASEDEKFRNFLNKSCVFFIAFFIAFDLLINCILKIALIRRIR
jgi:hypothetical protein